MERIQITQLICERLKSELADIKSRWNQSAQKISTRHVSIDNLLPEEITKEICEAFKSKDIDWHELNSFRENKKTLAQISKAPAIISEITYALQSPEVVEIVEEITQIPDVHPDPGLYAGGISMMTKGDFLNPHIDNSHDASRKKYRKLNLLFYVTPNWAKDNGGNLELWDERVTTPIEIVSKFNRLVLMETNKTSWHSVNKVRSNEVRCCVSNYYFAANHHPYEHDYYHVTSFMGRPEEKLIRLYSSIDNGLRQAVAKNLKISRGRKLVNDHKTIN